MIGIKTTALNALSQRGHVQDEGWAYCDLQLSTDDLMEW